MVPRYRNHYPTDVNQEVLKQLPHMITGVNLFHFYFCVHIAVIQEVDVCNFDLKVEKKITIKNKNLNGIMNEFNVTLKLLHKSFVMLLLPFI